jgi:hypothetical protein
MVVNVSWLGADRIRRHHCLGCLLFETSVVLFFFFNGRLVRTRVGEEWIVNQEDDAFHDILEQSIKLLQRVFVIKLPRQTKVVKGRCTRPSKLGKCVNGQHHEHEIVGKGYMDEIVDVDCLFKDADARVEDRMRRADRVKSDPRGGKSQSRTPELGFDREEAGKLDRRACIQILHH